MHQIVPMLWTSFAGNVDDRTRRICAVVERIDLLKIDVAKRHRIMRSTIGARLCFHRVRKTADPVVVVVGKRRAQEQIGDVIAGGINSVHVFIRRRRNRARVIIRPTFAHAARLLCR